MCSRDAEAASIVTSSLAAESKVSGGTGISGARALRSQACRVDYVATEALQAEVQQLQQRLHEMLLVWTAYVTVTYVAS